MGMYQTVEDEEVREEEAGTSAPRLRVLAAGGVALAALLGVAVMSLPSGDPAPVADGAEALAPSATARRSPSRPRRSAGRGWPISRMYTPAATASLPCGRNCPRWKPMRRARGRR